MAAAVVRQHGYNGRAPGWQVVGGLKQQLKQRVPVQLQVCLQ
jgi:hypothetical protein